ncbi:hypothetical protein HU200_016780 [Digitaria exilis]|uniref:Major facilitator superfamily (MFS) profile domain-containing protein n=1 Tax=Digitaria exilis TaxID=1010633 RepID=A0A835F7Q9_9POAL|nr:hypothetical protein HU200_016780 [Digitaria exilis]
MASMILGYVLTIQIGRHGGPEWSGPVHQEGSQAHGRAAGDPDGRPEPLLDPRLLRGRPVGRRYAIVLTAAIFFAAALLMAFATSYASLMAGQFVAGLGVGYAGTIPPMYTAEISPASARGLLSSLPEVFTNVGMLLGYLSNYAFAHLPLYLGWRVMLGINAFPSVLLALMVLGMPESPRWLVLNGRVKDAMLVLEKIADTSQEAAASLPDIKAASGILFRDVVDGDVVTVHKSSNEWHVWRELVLSPSPAMRRILLAALGIHFFQQASGIYAFVLYSPRIFMDAGVTDDHCILAITCALGATRALFTLVATFLLDRVGRRPLLLCSTGGMVFSLAGLAVGLTVIGGDPDTQIIPWANGLAIASTVTHNAFYSIGLGSITWVYSTEILPLRVRALGCALGVAFNGTISGLVAMTFLSMSKAITIGGTFFVYAGIAMLAWVFFFTSLPETKGRTLEEMGKLFGMTDICEAEAQGSAAKGKAAEIRTPLLCDINSGHCG